MVRLLLVSGSEALTGLVQSIGRLNIRLTYLPRFQVALQKNGHRIGFSRHPPKPITAPSHSSLIPSKLSAVLGDMSYSVNEPQTDSDRISTTTVTEGRILSHKGNGSISADTVTEGNILID